MFRILFSLIFCFAINVHAQYSIIESPKSFQLFPRDNANHASVVVKGQITSGLIKKISLLVKKENNLLKYHSLGIANNSVFPLDYNFATVISALPQEYSFRLFIHSSNTDSVEVMYRERIVCGDIYVLYGQSNMVAQTGINESNSETDDRLLRNFDFANNNYDPNSLQWFPAEQPYGSVGVLGIKLQSLIMSEKGIPTCVINGSSGGLPISALNYRDENNHANLNTVYGRLLAKIQTAGGVGKIKGILWRQGENEACTWYVDVNNYPGNFNTLYNNMNQDFGMFDYFYNIQIGIYTCGCSCGGTIREFQRKTKYLYPKIRTANCMGIATPDAVHHTKNGYEQIATELFNQLNHDIYNSVDSIEITPPDIQKVIKKPSNDTLILVFDRNQKMLFPNDTTIDNSLWQLKSYFYVNQSNATIQNIWANGNKVFIKLNQTINSGTLNYLPARHSPVYVGTHLKNSKGLRAFSFENFTIASQLSTRPKIDSVVQIANNKTRIYFQNPVSGYKIALERKKNNELNFQYMSESNGNFIDDNSIFVSADSLIYRIQITNSTTESEYSVPVKFPSKDCLSNMVLNGMSPANASYSGKNIVSTQNVVNNVQYKFIQFTELLPNFKTDNQIFFEVIKIGCPN
jgi:Carbohydrate esterase, sialic acid-specific acetylesterase